MKITKTKGNFRFFLYTIYIHVKNDPKITIKEYGKVLIFLVKYLKYESIVSTKGGLESSVKLNSS